VKKLFALRLVAGFVVATTVGCGGTPTTKATGGTGGTPATKATEKKT
jgi:hypothetical protein